MLDDGADALRRANGAADYPPLPVRRFAPAIKRLKLPVGLARTRAGPPQLIRSPFRRPTTRMAYLMEMAFDNTRRLTRKRYLFEYRGIRFKLVQDNPRRWADHLLTILPDDSDDSRRRAFSAAAEFASALCWQNNAKVAIREQGGGGYPDDMSLQDAQPRMFTFPRIPYHGNVRGFDLMRIPYIETEAQRLALALFREAGASNNDYLAFLFYWQTLEVAGADPVGFISKTLRKHRRQLRLSDDDLNQLPLKGRSLGQYLLDDCRHAIAHIRRRPGRARLDLDVREERFRLYRSTRVIEEFARCYIANALGLSRHQYLVREKPRAFPVYVGDHSSITMYRRLAYPPLRLRLTRRRGELSRLRRRAP